MPAPALEWRETARADLLSIIDYISDDNPEAAQQLKNQIDAKISSLPDHPKLYKSGRVAGTREMVVHANYLVVYSETASTIAILRILHAARQWPVSEDFSKHGI